MAAQVTAIALRWALGLLFLYTGAIKIWHMRDFAFDVESYQLTSPMVTDFIAFYLPWLEVTAALAVLSRRLYLGGLTALTAMVTIFLFAISSAWVRRLDLTCGCFGPTDNRTNYPLHIGIDLALLAAVTALFILEARRIRNAG